MTWNLFLVNCNCSVIWVTYLFVTVKILVNKEIYFFQFFLTIFYTNLAFKNLTLHEGAFSLETKKYVRDFKKYDETIFNCCHILASKFIWCKENSIKFYYLRKIHVGNDVQKGIAIVNTSFLIVLVSKNISKKVLLFDWISWLKKKNW